MGTYLSLRRTCDEERVHKSSRVMDVWPPQPGSRTTAPASVEYGTITRERKRSANFIICSSTFTSLYQALPGLVSLVPMVAFPMLPWFGQGVPVATASGPYLRSCTRRAVGKDPALQ